MIELLFTLIFVGSYFFIALSVKSILYIYEHEESIENEIKIFDDNFKKIHNLQSDSDYKLGSGHLYE